MSVNVIKEIKSLNTCLVRHLFANKNVIQGKRPKPLQVEIIDYLSKNQDKIIYQRDLEENLQISKAAISEVLISMEKNGFIEKINDEDDGRKKRVILTQDTIKMHNKVIKELRKLNNNLLDGISEEDLNIFIKVINKLKDNMKKEGV